MKNDITKQFLEAYEAYDNDIFRHIVFRISNRERAKELTQEVFMKVWDYLSKGNNIDEIRPFLYKVARNIIIDELRKRKEVVSLDAISETGFDVGFDEEGKHELEFESKALIKLLDELQESDREVLVMRYLDELSIKEIAEDLEESENTISVRIHRALKKLAEVVEKYEQQHQ